MKDVDEYIVQKTIHNERLNFLLCVEDAVEDMENGVCSAKKALMSVLTVMEQMKQRAEEDLYGASGVNGEKKKTEVGELTEKELKTEAKLGKAYTKGVLGWEYPFWIVLANIVMFFRKLRGRDTLTGQPLK